MSVRIVKNWNGSIPLMTKGRRRDNLWYNLAKRYENTVSSSPHNILHKLFPKTSDLKLMPMVWKPKQCKNTNFKGLSIGGKKHLEQKTAEIMNSSLAVEKIDSIFGFSLLYRESFHLRKFSFLNSYLTQLMVNCS